MSQNIAFHLSVCSDRSEVTLNGKKYSAGYRGTIELEHKIENDILKIDLSGIGHRPEVGGASHITAVDTCL